MVVGATPRGLAAAAELAGAESRPHLVDPAEQLLAGTVDPDLATELAEQLAAAGVRLQLSTTVAELLGTDGRLHAVRTSTGELPADLAVLAATAPPDPGPARSAGLSLDPTAGAVATTGCAPRRPGCSRPARCAQPPDPLPGGRARTSTPRVGWPEPTPPGRPPVPRRLRGLERRGRGRVVGGAGYGETAAAAAGLDYVLGRAEGISRARYYPACRRSRSSCWPSPGRCG